MVNTLKATRYFCKSANRNILQRCGESLMSYTSSMDKLLLTASAKPHGHFWNMRRTSSESDATDTKNTVLVLLRKWDKIFSANNIPEPDLSALHIMSHVLGTNHNDLSLKASYKLNERQLAKLDALCQHRLKRMPIQYIIGEWDFRDLTLKLRPPVFIPRPETEELVDAVVTHLKGSGQHGAKILEIGCGSGAISVSLLKTLPKASSIAVDQSEAACLLTLENAAAYNCQNRLQVKKAQLTDCGFSDLNITEKFDVLVSNPPYIPHSCMKTLQPEIALYEDTLALDGGEDGLRIIKMILNFAPSVLTNTGHVFLEVHYNHAEAIYTHTRSSVLGLSYEQTVKDFAGKDRFVKLRFKNR